MSTLVLKDRVKETCTGTDGNFTFAGAVSGYVAFSTVGNNKLTYYAVEDADGTKWEVGLGTLNADSSQIARTTVLSNQAGNTTTQTFSGGTHTIYCVYPADKSVHIGANIDIGDFSFTAQTLVSDVATGTAPITVSSTTKVANLNADKLDDQEGSYYLDFSNFVVDAGEIAIAKLASSSIGVSDGSSTTEISLGQDIQFRGTANEVEVEEVSGTITIGLPSSITADLTGDVTGNADTATEATNITVSANNSADETVYPIFVDGATGTQGAETDTGLTYNPNSGLLTAAGFSGPLTGNVTGNASGSSGSCTGNAATATALASAVNIGGTSFDGTSSIVPGTITVADTTDTSSFVALFESATGNLAPKTDAGITYNAGTGTLTATAFAGPLTGNVTGNVSGTAATVTAAAQGNITSLGTLTALTVDDVAIDGKIITMTGSTDDTAVFTVGTNGTLSIVTTDTAAAAANIEITADGTVDINSAGVLTLDSGAAINIEPASGSAILLDGTISIDAGVVTGATSITSTAFVGDLTGDVTGNADTATTATNATHVTVTDNESTNENNLIPFIEDASATGNVGLESDGDFHYNPSTGKVTATAFAGEVIDFNGTTGNNKLELTDNLASALDVTQSSNSYMKFVTTNSAESITTSKNIVQHPDMSNTALTGQSGSITINANLGSYFTVATTGALTIDITNAVVGQKILIRFAWGGDHTLGFANTTVIWPGGTAPGTTASGVDMIGFICTTASSNFDGFIVGEDIKSS